jgi:o-succinylbenzoate---CoA ligase
MDKISFTLNGKILNTLELQALCKTIISCSITEEWERKVYAFILNWLDQDSQISIQTSGSTGAPKLMQFRKSQLEQSARMTGLYFSLNKGDRILLCLSADYIAGKMVIVRALVLGLDLIIVKPSANLCETLKDCTFEFAAMVPLQVEQIMNTDRNVLGAIKTLIIGGSTVNASLMKRLCLVNSKIYITYGMAETLSHIAVKRIGENSDKTGFEALPGVELECDANSCLVISSSCLGIDRLTSNDIVSFDAAHNFSLVGRIDNVINSGGVKLFPETIENIIAPALEDANFFVFGAPDVLLGERVELLIEGSPFTERSLVLLKLYCKNNLAKYSVPQHIHFTPRFEMTDSGKIRRKDTLSKFLAAFQHKFLL